MRQSSNRCDSERYFPFSVPGAVAVKFVGVFAAEIAVVAFWRSTFARLAMLLSIAGL